MKDRIDTLKVFGVGVIIGALGATAGLGWGYFDQRTTWTVELDQTQAALTDAVDLAESRKLANTELTADNRLLEARLLVAKAESALTKHNYGAATNLIAEAEARVKESNGAQTLESAFQQATLRPGDDSGNARALSNLTDAIDTLINS